MSVGFLLASPSDAVIWRGPKKNGKRHLILWWLDSGHPGKYFKQINCWLTKIFNLPVVLFKNLLKFSCKFSCDLDCWDLAGWVQKNFGRAVLTFWPCAINKMMLISTADYWPTNFDSCWTSEWWKVQRNKNFLPPYWLFHVLLFTSVRNFLLPAL